MQQAPCVDVYKTHTHTPKSNCTHNCMLPLLFGSRYQGYRIICRLGQNGWLAMKLRHRELACHQQGLMQQLRQFWEEGRLCDVVLQSLDGTQHHAHRNVLSAASPAVRILLCGPFKEMKQVEEGKPVEMAASSSVVAAFLDYLYGGEPDVTAMDSVELLHLASAYDLPRLATTVERDLRDALDSAVALQSLLDSQTFGFPDLMLACEKQVAKEFQKCCLEEDFLKLDARQLQKILLREDLNVSREEIVFEALFRWSQYKENSASMCLLFPQIDFPSLSTSNLDLLRYFANALGRKGIDLENEVQQALEIHRKRPSESSSGHRPKRRCFTHWSATLGSSCNGSYPSWKKLTPNCTSCARFSWHDDSFLLLGEDQLMSFKPGSKDFEIVVGEGAATIKGCNALSHPLAFAVRPSGEIFIGTFCKGATQLVTFREGKGKVVKKIPDLVDVCCSPNGVVYVLDAGGLQVQKLEGSKLAPVLQSSEDQSFQATSIFATKCGLYLLDCKKHRILRLSGGSRVITEIANFSQVSRDLGRFFVTSDEQIFVIDRCKNRILIAEAKNTSCGTPHLDSSRAGKAQDVLVQNGYLNVLTHEGCVYQSALPPKLRLEGHTDAFFAARQCAWPESRGRLRDSR